MRLWLATVCIMLACVSPAAKAQQDQKDQQQDKPQAHPLRVMSFNIRFNTPKDGDNAWPHRREHVIETIHRYDPDLLGVQEPLYEQAQYLREQLEDDYTMHGVGREDGKRKGEFVCIFYRSDRFELLDSGDFWLSETPQEPGSKSWDSALPRLASWVKLRDRASGRTFTYSNTHFDHRGPQARLESAKLILERLHDEPDLILTGDLNCTEDDAPIRLLVENDALHDAYRNVHPERSENERTYQGFTTQRDGSRIDYVFYRGAFTPIAATIVYDEYDGTPPSDHYPVTATLEFAP